LEGTLKITWFQAPCHQQGHLPLSVTACLPKLAQPQVVQ